MTPINRLTAGVAAALSAVASCAPHVAPKLDPAKTMVYERPATLDARPLDVHLARPREGDAHRPLLLYATGDGGWRGNDRDVFLELASLGYPVAGFSARNYLKNLAADTTTPLRLALDYERLIDFSRRALELPTDTPVVLVGVSRGAGLAVVAGGQRVLRRSVAGVLAIALTKEEEYVRHYRFRRGRTPPGVPSRELVMIQTYEYLPRLPVPVAVIQSTGDNYLPADKARDLFGPDTSERHLYEIPAKNHSFSNAREELYRQIEQSLDWIQSAPVGPLPAARRH